MSINLKTVSQPAAPQPNRNNRRAIMNLMMEQFLNEEPSKFSLIIIRGFLPLHNMKYN